MAENSDPNSSDSKQKEKKPVGRPRKLRHSNSQDTEPALKVTVQAVASRPCKEYKFIQPSTFTANTKSLAASVV